MSTKDIPKAVIVKQAPSIKPTSSQLNTHEEIRRITQIVECLELKREHPNDNEYTDNESQENPSIPVHLRVHLRREQLSPAKAHRPEAMASQCLFPIL